jgi:hypothetical protein
LGISLGVGLLDHIADLCLVFLNSFHIVLQSGCNSLHSHQQPFSYILANTVGGGVFDDTYSKEVR